ncbi:unnamed protein product [Effrenium voratum]|nr:unnamed protein product [Effrenium voratum]
MLALACLMQLACAVASDLPSLLVAMLARDEEQLLRKHLPLWRDIGDCFVLGLDSRNQDASEEIASELLVPKPAQVFHFDFEGFGSAKTRLLQECHQRFPLVHYVLLVEPDMFPVVSTFHREALSQRESVYAIHRSGKESRGERLADCVFRNDGLWHFKFRVHETPVRRAEGSGVPERISDTGWSVVEISGSVRDGQSRALKVRDELRLVKEDLKDYPGHPRLTYYAGALRYDLAMELREEGDGPKIQALAKKAVKVLARRSREGAGSEEHTQQQSAGAYFCARSYLDLLGNNQKAEQWFRTTMKLEPDFLYARVALIQMLFRQQRFSEAFKEAVDATKLGRPRLRLFMDSGPLHVCDIPLLSSKAIYYMYINATLRPELQSHPVWPQRARLLAASAACELAGGDSAERKMNDVQKLQDFWADNPP